MRLSKAIDSSDLDDILQDGRESLDIFMMDSFSEIDQFINEGAESNLEDIAEKLKTEDGFIKSLTFNKEIIEESDEE
jgi:hypothetical protein